MSDKEELIDYLRIKIKRHQLCIEMDDMFGNPALEEDLFEARLEIPKFIKIIELLEKVDE